MILYDQIPNKSLFKTEEICEICQIKPYVLRFWETEFVQIKPITNSSGKRFYQKKDVLIVSVLKDLLFERKLTIEKARAEIDQIDFEKFREAEKSNQNEEQLDLNENVIETNIPSSSIEDVKIELHSILSRIQRLKQRYNWA